MTPLVRLPRLGTSLLTFAALASSFSSSSRAEASCGDFGGLGVALVVAASAGTAITGGIITPAIIALSDDTKDYPFARNALLSVGAGGLVTFLYGVIDLSTGCPIVESLDAAGLLAVPGITLGVSTLTALLLWAYADEREAVPFAPGFVPREGGGTVAFGFSF